MMRTVILIVLSAAGCARAGSSSSVSYSSAAASFDSAGGAAKAPSYQSVAACGVAGDFSVSAAYAAKTGFIGSLGYVRDFELYTIPAWIGEHQLFQLGARQVLDDQTFFSVPSQRVAWTVVTGPLSREVAPDGTVKSTEVLTDSPAMVTGSSDCGDAKLEFVVHDNDPDNYGLYAGDGLPDLWQYGFFGEENKAALPLADPDADGTDNALEFAAGSDPLDPGSVFRPAVAGGPGKFSIRFDTVAGHSYRLEFSTELAPGSWSVLDIQTGNGSPAEFTVIPPPGELRLFYRVAPAP